MRQFVKFFMFIDFSNCCLKKQGEKTHESECHGMLDWTAASAIRRRFPPPGGAKSASLKKDAAIPFATSEIFRLKMAAR